MRGPRGAFLTDAGGVPVPLASRESCWAPPSDLDAFGLAPASQLCRPCGGAELASPRRWGPAEGRQGAGAAALRPQRNRRPGREAQGGPQTALPGRWLLLVAALAPCAVAAPSPGRAPCPPLVPLHVAFPVLVSGQGCGCRWDTHTCNTK